jgi:hypothetical protein
MTGVNVAIFLAATYHAVAYMDSPDFCGRTCHTVMQPEFTSHEGAAHARVPCVDCHIGSGASWFRALEDLGQLAGNRGGVRPLPASDPDTDREPPPSRDTCEECHWPERFVGDKLLVKTHFGDDERSARRRRCFSCTRAASIRSPDGRSAITASTCSQARRIRYLAADAGRQEIPYVPTGSRTGSWSSTPSRRRGSRGRRRRIRVRLRVMDCLDCHNRPTHRFALPEAAVDRALAAGVIERSLPSIRKVAVETLRADYASHEDAATRIPALSRTGLRHQRRQGRRCRCEAARRHLLGERLPRHARRLGHVSRQPRAPGLHRLLPLP